LENPVYAGKTLAFTPHLAAGFGNPAGHHSNSWRANKFHATCPTCNPKVTIQPCLVSGATPYGGASRKPPGLDKVSTGRKNGLKRAHLADSEPKSEARGAAIAGRPRQAEGVRGQGWWFGLAKSLDKCHHWP